MLLDTKVYYKPSDNTIHVMCHRQGIIRNSRGTYIEGHKLTPRYTAVLCKHSIFEREKIVNEKVIPMFAYGTWQLPENCWNGGFEKDIRDNLFLINATYKPWWIKYRNKLVARYPDITSAAIIKE